MKQYTFEVALAVSVDAFNEGDARELIEDVLGEGTINGVEVIDYRIKRKVV